MDDLTKCRIKIKRLRDDADRDYEKSRPPSEESFYRAFYLGMSLAYKEVLYVLSGLNDGPEAGEPEENP